MISIPLLWGPVLRASEAAYARQDGRLTSTSLGKTLDASALGRLTQAAMRAQGKHTQ